MSEVCFQIPERERQAAYINDPLDRLSTAGLALVTTYFNSFEAAALPGSTVTPSEGERLALRRAMARFLIDTGIASDKGWLV